MDSIEDDSRKFYENDFLSVLSKPGDPASHPSLSDSTPVWGKISVKPGMTYVARVYFWNDSYTSYASAAVDPNPIVAKDVHAKVSLPKQIRNEAYLQADITGSNTVPTDIYDDMVLKGDDPAATYKLSIVPGSAYVQGDAAGAPRLSVDTDSLTSSAGALLGCTTLDGVINGYGSCQGILYFSFHVDRSGFTSYTGVRATNSSAADIHGGDNAEIYVIIYNNSDSSLDGIEFSERLASGLRLAKNSPDVDINDGQGRITHWPVSFSTGPPDASFWVTHSSPDVPPGGQIELDFTATLDYAACQGGWYPIRSDTWVSGVDISSTAVLNALPTC